MPDATGSRSESDPEPDRGSAPVAPFGFAGASQRPLTGHELYGSSGGGGFGAPRDQPSPAGPPSRPTRRWLGVLAVTVVLALAAGLGYLLVARDETGSDAGGAVVRSPGSPGPPTQVQKDAGMDAAEDAVASIRVPGERGQVGDIARSCVPLQLADARRVVQSDLPSSAVTEQLRSQLEADGWEARDAYGGQTLAFYRARPLGPSGESPADGRKRVTLDVTIQESGSGSDVIVHATVGVDCGDKDG